MVTDRAPALLEDLAARCVWPGGARPTLAVSGGPDSLALLVLAAHAGLDAEAVHVDHGLRPGSAAEADVVAAAAARFGVRFRAVRVEVAPGPNLEARARAARYAALPAGVLTGHTADDQAETVLLNLLRGAGLDGLAAMAGASAPGRAGPTGGVGGAGQVGSAGHVGPPGPARIGRPLLALRRWETHALCDAVGLRPVVDPSNADPAIRRNAVRQRLVPLLEELAGRDPVPVLTRQAQLAADDAAYLEQAAAAVDPTDARQLAAAPVALARRAVRAWLRDSSGPERHPPSAAEVARVLAVAAGDAVACEVSLGRRVSRSAGRLSLTLASGPVEAAPGR